MNIAQLVKRANDALQGPQSPPPPPGGPQGGMPPPDASGQPPAGQDGALPPELEQLINSLPPEALQQLLAEIQQDLDQQAGGQPGGAPPGSMPPGGGMAPGMDPGAGGHMAPPPPDGMPKQGSAKIIAHDANYIDGFMSQAAARGLNKQASAELYYAALELMQPAQVKQASENTNQLHYEGFTKAATATLGISSKEAHQLYLETFGLQR